MNRKLWCLLLFLAIGGPSVFVSAAQTEEPALARIEIPEPTYDFGTVAQGEKVSHDFIIKNVGTDTLLLEKVVASCGCTATTSSEQQVAPGGETTVSVVFDTDGFTGEKIKTVRLYTNDPRQVSYLLTLRGTVQPEVQVEPKRIYFGEVTQGRSASREVTVSVREGSKIKLGNFRSRGRGFLVTQLEGSNPQFQKFLVSVEPDVKTGELRDRIVVDVVGGTQRTINIPIYAAVQGAVRLAPRALTFGVIEGSEVITRSVTLENDSEQMLEIVDLSVNHPAIGVEHKVLEPGKRFEVRVSLDPAKVSSDVRTSVDIRTNAEGSDRLSLSVYGVLPPKL